MTIHLHHCDSIAKMSELIAKGFRADLIVTDPPYKLESGGSSNIPMGGIFNKENYDNGGQIVKCDIDWADFMPLLYGILADNSHCYVMCNNRHVMGMLNSAEAAGFRFHNLLVWDKISPTPNRWYMKNCEFIGFFYKGKAKWIKEMGAKQLIKCAQVDDDSGHPTQKPVGLFEHYIKNSSNRGDIVLDPFMGSGSCGIAATKQGRRFIGMEIEKKYFDYAKQAISETQVVNTLL